MTAMGQSGGSEKLVDRRASRDQLYIQLGWQDGIRPFGRDHVIEARKYMWGRIMVRYTHGFSCSSLRPPAEDSNGRTGEAEQGIRTPFLKKKVLPGLPQATRLDRLIQRLARFHSVVQLHRGVFSMGGMMRIISNEETCGDLTAKVCIRQINDHKSLLKVSERCQWYHNLPKIHHPFLLIDT